MERTSCLKLTLLTIVFTATTLSGYTRAVPQYHGREPLIYPTAPGPSYIISPQNTPDNPHGILPKDYQSAPPHPLMRGEDFNYHLYYNYQLTPHIILRPNLQQRTEPGAVSDRAQRFIGGLNAGINF